jgi:hypothetical protein
MAKPFILISILLTSFSCRTGADKNSSNVADFIENTIDFVTEHKDNNVLELPSLYDSLATQLPADSAETLLLAESLKKRGFKVINWGRGNFPPRGPRFVSLTLQKKNCFCEVSKIYYSTLYDMRFEMAERISCADSVTFYSVGGLTSPEKNTTKGNTVTTKDSISTTEHFYDDLSNTVNFNLKLKRKYDGNGEIIIGYQWALYIIDKRNNNLIDSIRQAAVLYQIFQEDSNKVRSFTTGKNKTEKAVDNDYGDLVIADLNFDSREDIALVNDDGGNGGRFYSYYLQGEDKNFHLDQFLTDSMVYFPAQINKKSKTLVTYVHAGVCGLGEHKYLYSARASTWREISHKRINICDE